MDIWCCGGVVTSCVPCVSCVCVCVCVYRVCRESRGCRVCLSVCVLTFLCVCVFLCRL